MEAVKPVPNQRQMRRTPWLGTLSIVAIYAAVMFSTNHLFTFLDDESMSIALAGHPVIPTLRLFLAGAGFHEEHPPFSNILLHLWLVGTHFSFFALRIFANILFIGGILFTALSAEKIGGRRAYWGALLLGFVWPFAFQYGRIDGWYCLSMFLVSLVTWTYLRLLDSDGYRPWIEFGIACVLLTWSNYFGFVILFLLFADFLTFHRDLAVTRVRPLLVVMGIVALGFLPVVKIALADLAGYVVPVASRMDWRNEIASAGYPAFAIFGSAAIAPWYMPLSLPVFVCVIGLFACIWFSKGRKWLTYFILTMLILQISGQMDIKRVLFLTPWLFLAMTMTVCGAVSRYPRIASGAIAVIVCCGWIGIISGRHYATTNLNEPWGKVAQVVAQDARSGATIIGGNPSFFLYLDYQLGVQSNSEAAEGTYLGEDIYRSHGYKVLHEEDLHPPVANLRGKVVYVMGAVSKDELPFQNALNDQLRDRCSTMGEYRAAPDPAAALKARFSRYAPILAYRTEVIWYDCPIG